MISLRLLLITAAFYLPILCNGEDNEFDGYSDDNDSYYSIQTPHVFVDLLFILFILIHSVYYSYKLINYSLENLSIKKETYHPRQEKMEHFEDIIDDTIKLKSDYFDTSAP